MVHVYPSWQAEHHELSGTMCPCGPRVEWEHAEALVLHNEMPAPAPAE